MEQQVLEVLVVRLVLTVLLVLLAVLLVMVQQVALEAQVDLLFLHQLPYPSIT
jgi:hypothetical protein